MNRWLRLPLGVVSFGVGGAVLSWVGVTSYIAVNAGEGFQLVNLCGVAIGCAVAGFGADWFGWLRPRGDEEKSPVARSVWADRAAIERAEITEKPDAEAANQGILSRQLRRSNGRDPAALHGRQTSDLLRPDRLRQIDVDNRPQHPEPSAFDHRH